MQLRIIHVVWSATIGGIEKMVIDLANEQKNNAELKVSILIARPEGGFMPMFRDTGVAVHTLDMRSGGDISPVCYRRARKLFGECDIIHMHSFNPLVAVAARYSGKKIIYTEHGNFGIGRKFSLRRQMVLSLQKKFLNNYVTLMTFNSEFTMKTAELRYGLQRVKKKVLYNGIVIPFTPAQINDPVQDQLQNHFVVGTIARLAHVKRIDRLIAGFADFAGNKKTKLLIIGDGPLLPMLQQQAAILDIADKVIFAGYRNDARSYLQLMDIVVIPSVSEAFGIAAVEAWDAGKAVIAFSDSGGLAELVIKDDPANIVADEKHLAKRLDFYFNLSSSSVPNEKLIALAKQFDIKRMQQELFTIYKTA